MRVLWISMNAGLLGIRAGNTHYNGGGWISSLQRLFIGDTEVELGIAFLSSISIPKKIEENVTYFPVVSKNKSIFDKFRYYYGGFKHPNRELYVNDMLKIIDEFQPDIIHLFGIENSLARIVGKTSIPIVTHIQGILSPYANAFWPVGFNKYSFLHGLSIRERILKNGYGHMKDAYTYNAILEKELFRSLKFVMGRTQWDYEVSKLLAPNSKYYHVDEVLRETFYKHQGVWKKLSNGKLKIISTLSNTVYKGLDLVLKTAALLKEISIIDFEWNVVGLKENYSLVKIFERELNIISSAVNVKYCGILTSDELSNIEQYMSLYVHPSYIDNSPNSLCEAQLIGLPVIATNVGGIPSLIDHMKTGFLIPANAPYELAYRIIWAYEHPNEVEKIAADGVMVAQARHDRRKIKNDLMNVYKDILKING